MLANLNDRNENDLAMERKLLHLLLNHKAAIAKTKGTIDPDLLDSEHRNLCRHIFDYYAKGSGRLTRDTYASLIDHHKDYMHLLHIYDLCFVGTDAELDELQAIIEHITDAAIARKTIRGLHEFGETAKVKDFATATRKLREHLNAIDTEPERPLLVYKNWKQIQNATIEWIWDDVLPRGVLGLLSMQWKEGKTTFVVSLAKKLTSGEPFGRATRKSKVVMVSEEPDGIWYWRGSNLELPEDDSFQILTQQQNKYTPSWDNWNKLFDDLALYCKNESVDLVIVDTLFAFAPWTSENDSMETRDGMQAPRRLSNAGPAVLLLHHPNRTTGEARGSGSIQAATDINLTLKMNGELEWKGRFGRGSCAFEFDPDTETYQYAGPKITPNEDRKDTLLATLKEQGNAMTANELRLYVQNAAVKTVRRDLETLALTGKVEKINLNGKTYAYKYKG